MSILLVSSIRLSQKISTRWVEVDFIFCDAFWHALKMSVPTRLPWAKVYSGENITITTYTRRFLIVLWHCSLNWVAPLHLQRPCRSSIAWRWRWWLCSYFMISISEQCLSSPPSPKREDKTSRLDWDFDDSPTSKLLQIEKTKFPETFMPFFSSREM